MKRYDELRVEFNSSEYTHQEVDHAYILKTNNNIRNFVCSIDRKVIGFYVIVNQLIDVV